MKVARLCPTLCDSMSYTVHGILQARILEWVAVPFSRRFSNPGIKPMCTTLQILYQLSYQGSPRILEWVAYPISSGSFWPRNQTRVSCIAGGFFTSWAIREAPVTPWVGSILWPLAPFDSRLTICIGLWRFLASLMAHMAKDPPATRETWVWSLGQEDSLEKGTATHSSILYWRIPRTEEPGRLQFMGSQGVRHDCTWGFHYLH